VKLDDVNADTSGMEDRRGRGGGLGSIPLGRGGKVGLPVILVLVVGVILKSIGGGGGGTSGIDVNEVIGQLGGASVDSGAAPGAPANSKDSQVAFVAKVRTLLNDYWGQVFQDSKTDFHTARVVFFDQPTSTGCGVGQPEAGPFYCPSDEAIYLDFAFYDQLQKQLGFGGDFAEAYVVAHEFGHHIQNLLGINEKVRSQSEGASEAEANRLSVKLELQADCFAGAWAHSAFAGHRLESGDVDEALGAAAAVGDDAIQKKTQGRVDQESFTHGSSADRQKWFKAGFDSGDPQTCDTFA
jgi:predicted metalloprotease